MTTRSMSVVICLSLLCLPVLAAEMSVHVKQAQLRAQPGPLAKIGATLAYGTRVSVLEEQTDWILVEVPERALKGWVHRSALTQKKLVLRSGSGSTNVSGDEIVLAGKGFNAQVEEKFKQQNQNLNYGWLDKMEQNFAVPQQSMQQFLKDGALSVEGGAL
jgi:hypothetical protein